nr:ORF1a polyprotein [Allamanda chlorotic virus A]
MALSVPKNDLISCLNLDTMYSDLLKQVTSKLNFKDNSDLFMHVDQSLKTLLKEKEDVLSSKPKCIITTNLENESRAVLDAAFPELQITYTGSTKSEHPMCYAVRMAFNTLFHTFSATSDCIDIGGCAQVHRKLGHTRTHVCNPTLSGKDVTRRVLDLNDAMKVLASSSTSTTTTVSESMDEVTSCTDKFEQCSHRAFSAYMVDVYDITLLNLVNGMDKHRCTVVNIAMILPVELLESCGEVEIRDLNTVVRWDYSDVTYFIGNSGDSFKHNRHHLVEYLTVNRVVSDLGNTYDITFEGSRLGYKFFRIVRSSSHLAPVTLMRRYDATLSGMYHCILPMPTQHGYVTKDLYIDGDFVERVEAYLVNVSTSVESRTFDYTMSNVRSQKTHLVVGSRTVHSKVDLDAADLPILAAVLLADSVKKRSAAMHVAKDYMNRSTGLWALISLVYVGLQDRFKRKGLSIKLAVLKKLCPKTHQIFLAMDTPLTKVDSKVDVQLIQMRRGNSTNVGQTLYDETLEVVRLTKRKAVENLTNSMIGYLKEHSPEDLRELSIAGLESGLTANLLAKRFLASNINSVLASTSEERGTGNLETVEEMRSKLKKKIETLDDQRRKEFVPELWELCQVTPYVTVPEKCVKAVSSFMRWLSRVDIMDVFKSTHKCDPGTTSEGNTRSHISTYPSANQRCNRKDYTVGASLTPVKAERNVDKWDNYVPNMGRKRGSKKAIDINLNLTNSASPTLNNRIDSLSQHQDKVSGTTIVASNSPLGESTDLSDNVLFPEITTKPESTLDKGKAPIVDTRFVSEPSSSNSDEKPIDCVTATNSFSHTAAKVSQVSEDVDLVNELDQIIMFEPDSSFKNPQIQGEVFKYDGEKVLRELNSIVPKFVQSKNLVQEVESDNNNQSDVMSEDSVDVTLNTFVNIPTPTPPVQAVQIPVEPRSKFLCEFENNNFILGKLLGFVPNLDLTLYSSVFTGNSEAWVFSKVSKNFLKNGVRYIVHEWQEPLEYISKLFGNFDTALISKIDQGKTVPIFVDTQHGKANSTNLAVVNFNEGLIFSSVNGVDRSTYSLLDRGAVVIKSGFPTSCRFSLQSMARGGVCITFSVQQQLTDVEPKRSSSPISTGLTTPKENSSPVSPGQNICHAAQRTHGRVQPNLPSPAVNSVRSNSSSISFNCDADPIPVPDSQKPVAENLGDFHDDDEGTTDNLFNIKAIPLENMSVDSNPLVEVLKKSLSAGNEWVLSDSPWFAINENSLCPPRAVPDNLGVNSTLEYTLLLGNSCFKIFERFQKLYRNKNVLKTNSTFPAGVSSLFKQLHIFNRHRKTVYIDGESEAISNSFLVFSLSSGRFIEPKDMEDCLDKEGLFCVDDDLFKGIQFKLLRNVVRLGKFIDFESRFGALTVTLEDTPPGGGKTTNMIKRFHMNRSGTRILTANLESSVDINKKLEIDTGIRGRRWARTIDSKVINALHIGRAHTVCVDECFLVHSGELKISIVLSGAETVYLYGDSQQIPFINRLQTFHCKCPVIDTSKFNVVRRNVSYRCPGDVCALLSEKKDSRGNLCYPAGVKKGDPDKPNNSVTYKAISSLTDVDMEDGDLFVTFTQDEKHSVNSELKRRRVKAVAKTVHEIQGKTVPSVKLVRLKAAEDAVFTMTGHEIVALSRHTCGAKYYSISKRLFDGIGKDIKTMMNYKESVFRGIEYEQCS